ncbi:MAG TPA: protein-disulfide reductase DsbD domain-containing protein [Rhizomicrobium sp.]|nr:protein-disulfide reductase DsbD domain-containing protein [Rhizomicrobium sp.]
MSLRAVLLALAAFVALAVPAAAQVDSVPKVHARLIAENGEVAPGGSVTIALEEDIREGWHTYWQNSGDAGAPTTIDWTLPQGWHVGAIAWPYPKRLPAGPLMQYGYDGKPWLLMPLTAPKDAKQGDVVTLKGHAQWLVCSSTLCVPEEQMVSLQLAVVADPAPPYATVAQDFQAARALIPVASPWPARFARKGGTLDLFLAAPKLAPKDATFYPFEQGFIKGSAGQKLGEADGGVVLQLAPDAKTPQTLGGVLVLTSADNSVQALAIAARPGAVPSAQIAGGDDMGVVLALLFAFVGGLILNLMPCVLPILAMKAFAVASKAGTEHAARDGLAYGAGAILSFLVLGGAVLLLRAGGDAVGWGFQLQEPRVVAAFALLMFAVGLNLSGVFELPGGITAGDSLARKSGPAGAFFTGVLAVAVAAPCTAPFMAAAIGFALTQGAASALGVFFFLGLGFAAPFIAIGLSPALLRLLPKPGAWMLTLKQLLAFPMYGAAAWLVWVLAQQAGTVGLAASLASMVAFAFAAWAWSASRDAGLRWRGVGTGAALVGLVLAVASVVVAQGEGMPASASVPSSGALHAEAYTPARLAELRKENRPVFVDATAAWCITCLVNEKIALSSPAVAEAFARTHTAYLVADWTKRDADITALLSEHDRSGVPLYLFYKPGAPAADVLPQILTPDAVLTEMGAK